MISMLVQHNQLRHVWLWEDGEVVWELLFRYAFIYLDFFMLTQALWLTVLSPLC